jgi:hypothetical protein
MADLNRPPQPDDPNYAQWLYQFWLKNQQSPKVVVSAGTNSISSGTANFSNSNNVTFGMAMNGVVTASVSVAPQTAISGIVGSNTTYTSGTVSFADGNGVSWGTGVGQKLSITHTLQYLSNTSAITSNAAGSGFTTTTTNGSVILGTNNSAGLKLAVPPYLTVAAGGGGAAVSLSGNSTSAGAGYSNISSGTAIFAGGNNITLSQNGANITISGANTVAQSVQPVAASASNGSYNFSTLKFVEGSGVTWATQAGGIQASVKTDYQSSNANYLTSQSNQAFSASGGSSAFQTLGFSNANNVTFSNSGGSVVASASFAQTNQTGNLYVTANSTQLSSTAGIDYRSLSFAGAGVASVGVSGGVVVVSVPTGGGAGDGVNIVQAGTLGTTGTTYSASTGTVRINGGNNITVSQNNSNDIVIIGPSAGGSTVSHWQNLPAIWTAPTTLGMTNGTRFYQSTSMAFPLFLDVNLSINKIRMLKSVSLGTTQVATVANTSWGFSNAETHNFVFYSQGSGANSESMQSYASTSYGLSISVQGSVGAASNNISVKHSISAPMSSGYSLYTFSTAPAGSSVVLVASTHVSNFISGLRLWDSSFGTVFPQNEYWCVYGVSSGLGTTGGASAATALTACTLQHAPIVYPMVNSNIAAFGTSNQAFNNVSINAGGSFSTNAIATTASIHQTKFSSMASNAVPHFYMERIV